MVPLRRPDEREGTGKVGVRLAVSRGGKREARVARRRRDAVGGGRCVGDEIRLIEGEAVDPLVEPLQVEHAAVLLQPSHPDHGVGAERIYRPGREVLAIHVDRAENVVGRIDRIVHRVARAGEALVVKPLVEGSRRRVGVQDDVHRRSAGSREEQQPSGNVYRIVERGRIAPLHCNAQTFPRDRAVEHCGLCRVKPERHVCRIASGLVLDGKIVVHGHEVDALHRIARHRHKLGLVAIRRVGRIVARGAGIDVSSRQHSPARIGVGRLRRIVGRRLHEQESRTADHPYLMKAETGQVKGIRAGRKLERDTAAKPIKRSAVTTSHVLALEGVRAAREGDLLAVVVRIARGGSGR